MCGFVTSFDDPVNLDFFMRGGGVKLSRLFKLTFMTRIFIALCFLTSVVMADVKSTTGQIKFDTQMDNQAEMTLNGTGLGIGVTPSSNLHVNGNAIISDQLFVGGSSGSSNLNVNGTLGYGLQTVSSNTTLGDSSIVLVDSSSDNITITLPYAGNVTGRQYQIKKIATTNSVWISGGGNLIDDTSPVELPESSNLASVKLISDGSQWYKIDQKDVSETVAADNLVGWWKLDETIGITANDSSGRENHGVLNNGLTFSGCVISGKIGNALSFDGSDDVIVTPSSSIYDMSNSNLSIALWVNSSATFGTERMLFEHSIWSAADTYQLTATNDTTLRFAAVGLGTFDYSIDFTDGNWHFIVAVFDTVNNIKSLYYDGVLSNAASETGNIGSGNNPIYIGARGDGSKQFPGDIDDVRLYNRVLTSSEVEALYNQGH